MAAKILLVEDDNNLREIYEARLLAEGYTIVTAKDGEEALVVAKAEMPDLVISDVMMPRISGFEMLDILRNTENLKDTKVIMLTALGQADDKTRASSLGADRYLVKSQVTLEDIVKSAHELLEGLGTALSQPAPALTPPVAPSSIATPAPVAPAPAAPTPANPVVAPSGQQSPAYNPTVGAPMSPPAVPQPVTTVPAIPPTQPSTSDEQAAVGAQINQFVQAPAPSVAAQDDAVLADAMEDLAQNGEEKATEPAPTPVTPPAPLVQAVSTPQPLAAPSPSNTQSVDGMLPSGGKKVIQPLGQQEQKPSIHELLAREQAPAGAPVPPQPAPAPQVIAPVSSQPMTPPATAGPTVFTPTVPPAPAVTAAPQPPAQNGEFDPNNIAL